MDDDAESEQAAWQAGADLVRVDLVATTGLDLPLTVETMRWDFDDDELDATGLEFTQGTRESPDMYWSEDVPGGSVPPAEAAAHLAEMVQSNVMEHLQRPWPECPVHHRPMDPQPKGATGQWVCGKDPAHAAPIGGLGPWLAGRSGEC